MAMLTAEDRAKLLQAAWDLQARLYPADRSAVKPRHERALLREGYYSALGEYADRLPRRRLSTCPFTRAPFEHSFDPWGFDGPWWLEGREVEIDEPAPPSTFKVLLGAVALHGRVPSESRMPVIPGPDVPFVVPRLLGLPGMVAVVSQLDMATGDTAFPIVYFSEEEIPSRRLHQFWRSQDLWFTTEEGGSAWLIANDVWDFDLEPWLAQGKLRWIRPGDEKALVIDASSGEKCPFVGLPGERVPQLVGRGKRQALPLPDGRLVNPYED